MNTSAIPRGPSTDHVHELDGLRGVLSLSVVVSHTLLWCAFAEPRGPEGLHRLYQSVLYSQWAVEVFFILSGFAISYLIHSRAAPFGRFIAGRFFRIYPVYLVCLLLGMATAGLTIFVLETASWSNTSYFREAGGLVADAQAAPWQHLLAHLSLLQGVFPKDVLPGAAATLLVPAWSISVEWQYYLCALLIARFARSAIGLLALAGIAWLSLRYAEAWVNPLRAFLPLVLPFFIIGIGSFHLYSAFVASGARRAGKYSVVVAAALAGAILFQWHPIAMTVWILAFGSLFVTPAGWFGRALGSLAKVLRHPWVQLLGAISYPLYLVHWPLIIASLAILLRAKPSVQSGEAVVWVLVVALPMILGVAYLMHRLIEAPLMRVGRRMTGHTPRSRPGSATATPVEFAVGTLPK